MLVATGVVVEVVVVVVAGGTLVVSEVVGVGVGVAAGVVGTRGRRGEGRFD